MTGRRLCLPAGLFGPPPQIPSLASTFFLFLDLLGFPLFLSPFTSSCKKQFVAFSLGLALFQDPALETFTVLDEQAICAWIVKKFASCFHVKAPRTTLSFALNEGSVALPERAV